MKNVFANAEVFEKFLNTDEGEEFLENWVNELYEVEPYNFTDLPSWVGGDYSFNAKAFFVPSIWNYNSDDKIVELDGVKYQLKDRINMSGDLEFQLDDGEFFYWNHDGHSEVWDVID